jgi:hypothetical protein
MKSIVIVVIFVVVVVVEFYSQKGMSGTSGRSLSIGGLVKN